MIFISIRLDSFGAASSTDTNPIWIVNLDNVDDLKSIDIEFKSIQIYLH